MNNSARFWLARLLTAATSLCVTLVALFEPASLTHHLLMEQTPVGVWCVVALTALAALALADVVINDLLPDNCTWRAVRRRRYLVYMALAMGNLSLSLVLQQRIGWTWLHLQLWVTCSAACALAFFDTLHRQKERLAT